MPFPGSAGAEGGRRVGFTVEGWRPWRAPVVVLVFRRGEGPEWLSSGLGR